MGKPSNLHAQNREEASEEELAWREHTHHTHITVCGLCRRAAVEAEMLT